MTCVVRVNCLTATHCPYCVDGSEYTPRDRRVLFPTVVARKAGRKAARQTAAACRGRRARRQGLKAEREAARAFDATVVPGSGMWDGLPNDLVLPAGWRAEAKERTGQFGLLYRWTARDGVVQWTEPDGRVYVAMTQLVYQSGFRPAPVAHTRTGGFHEIRTWFAAEDADVLVCRRPHQPWLVVMDAAHWARLKTDEEAADVLTHV
jgi:hypothetical protein